MGTQWGNSIHHHHLQKKLEEGWKEEVEEEGWKEEEEEEEGWKEEEEEEEVAQKVNPRVGRPDRRFVSLLNSS